MLPAEEGESKISTSEVRGTKLLDAWQEASIARSRSDAHISCISCDVIRSDGTNGDVSPPPAVTVEVVNVVVGGVVIGCKGDDD